MFKFLKKKEEKTNQRISAPATGKFLEITEVADPVFSEKMMGDGFAVTPTDGAVYSPISGKVLSVFPTKHAIGLETSDGVEVLIHMGIDTVELNGGPFETHIKEGQMVTPETLVATMDLAALEAAEKDATIIVIVTNMDKLASFTTDMSGDVQAKTEVASYVIAK